MAVSETLPHGMQYACVGLADLPLWMSVLWRVASSWTGSGQVSERLRKAQDANWGLSFFTSAIFIVYFGILFLKSTEGKK